MENWPICTLTKEPLSPKDDCVILSGDGFTYACQSMLTIAISTGRSPVTNLHLPHTRMIRNILVQNMLAEEPVRWKALALCGITEKPLVEPVVLMADGHTYEKTVLQEWLSEHETSPRTGQGLDIPLYVPNRTLCQMLGMNVPSVGEFNLETYVRSNLARPLQITDLVTIQCPKLVDQNAWKALEQTLIGSQKNLPEPSKSYWGSPNVRGVAFPTGTRFCGLNLKGTSFSRSSFQQCIWDRCSFSRADLSGTDLSGCKFIECDFRGEETSFVDANLKDAWFSFGCILERGSTWVPVETGGEFQLELQLRGAKHTGSVLFVNPLLMSCLG